MNQEPRIRANRYSLMTLEWPAQCEDMADWLSEQCARAPALMQEISLVLKPADSIQGEAIEAAVGVMDSLHLDLIGLTGAPVHREVADQLGLAWLSDANVTEIRGALEDVGSQVPAQPSMLPPLVVEGPIRSGVQIYAKDRDLVVWGQVSAGAEVMADGHVHVYGKLIGRVAAGVSGRVDAQIFSASFTPQLISVAGLYAGSEQIPDDVRSATVRVGLDDAGQSLSYTRVN